jgi:hypothetical protein
MPDLALSHAKTGTSGPEDANPSGESVRKNFSAYIACNPLKSPDSDEIVLDFSDINDLFGR